MRINEKEKNLGISNLILELNEWARRIIPSVATKAEIS